MSRPLLRRLTGLGRCNAEFETQSVLLLVNLKASDGEIGVARTVRTGSVRNSRDHRGPHTLPSTSAPKHLPARHTTCLPGVRLHTIIPRTILPRGVPGSTFPGTSTCFHKLCNTTSAHVHILHMPALIWSETMCGQRGGVAV